MKQNKSFIKRSPMTLKVLIIGILILVLLIPISMVQSLIHERSRNMTTVEDEIISKWGGSQTITGPVLVVPAFRKSETEPDSRKVNCYFFPSRINHHVNATPEIRAVGPYEVLCYQAAIASNGFFNYKDLDTKDFKQMDLQWDDAFLLVKMENKQSLKNRIELTMNDSETLSDGVVYNDQVFGAGLKFDYPVTMQNQNKNFSFAYNTLINGTQQLYFTPMGKHMFVDLQTTWGSLGSVGEYLPFKKESDTNKSTAQWELSEYNYNYPQAWIGNATSFENEKFGISFILPVNNYQKVDRSAKYAVLFIALTFLVFFMVELISKKRIHPLQYLLVSFALILFYTLLLSFSEFIGYNMAYMIAAAAIVALITAYSYSVFKVLKQTICMSLFITCLYIFLFVIIQMENIALLLGSIGLFGILALVMYMTRNINWYKEDNKDGENRDEACHSETNVDVETNSLHPAHGSAEDNSIDKLSTK